jgi:hypothetical protein
LLVLLRILALLYSQESEVALLFGDWVLEVVVSVELNDLIGVLLINAFNLCFVNALVDGSPDGQEESNHQYYEEDQRRQDLLESEVGVIREGLREQSLVEEQQGERPQQAVEGDHVG